MKYFEFNNASILLLGRVRNNFCSFLFKQYINMYCITNTLSSTLIINNRFAKHQIPGILFHQLEFFFLGKKVTAIALVISF